MADENSEGISIGTSGWSYKEWEGVFYPNSKTPKLTFYSSIFQTGEIDSTFYANPSKGLVVGWSRNTPKGFEFSVKLPKAITHDRQLDLKKGAEVELRNFLDLMKPLSDSGKLGPLLIQLPPSFGSSKIKVLEQFLQALPTDKYRFAAEVRNKSWLKERQSLNELLTRYHVAKTIVDEPLLPPELDVTNDDFTFVRWHGHGTTPWYNYRYSEKEIEPWVPKVKELSVKTKKVYGYYNNHFHGYAVENSLELMEKLGTASKTQLEMLEKVRDAIEGGREEEEGPSERKQSKVVRDKRQTAITQF